MCKVVPVAGLESGATTGLEPGAPAAASDKQYAGRETSRTDFQLYWLGWKSCSAGRCLTRR
ncbi:MAG TPA: hypothetical protein VL986_01800 [Terracidiphilus sp.]|nr:hypothetical protein [Terracidiphilus sp.]